MVQSDHTGLQLGDIEKALVTQRQGAVANDDDLDAYIDAKFKHRSSRPRIQGVFFLPRLFARSIDLLFTIPLGIVLYAVVYIPVGMARAVIATSYMAHVAIDVVLGHILFLVAIVLHDATALTLAGTTVGKALFGIRVTTLDGSKPGFAQAMRRTEAVLRAHFYLIGFPVFTIAFVLATFSRIKREGSATWDTRANTILSVRPVGLFRLLLACTVGVVVLVGVFAADRLGKDQTKTELGEEVVSKMLAQLDAKQHPPVTYQSSRYSTWETVLVPGICTFKIPPTMELQAANSGNRIVAQQKGLNQMDPIASSRYARVIVNTQTEAGGDFGRLGEPLALTHSEVAEIDAAIKAAVEEENAQSIAAGFATKLLSWGGTSIVRVNGNDGLLTEYSRSVDNAPPVAVRIYKFLNHDCMHTVFVSYRTAEADLWANDLDEIITTFQFTRR